MVAEQVPSSPETPVVTEPSDTATAAPEGQASADEGTEQQEVQEDWQTKYTESEAKREKAEASLNSLKGNALRDAEFRDLFDNLSTRLDASEQTSRAVIKAYNSGETENLSQELGQIEQTAEMQKGRTAFVRKFESLTEDLKAIDGVPDGGPEEFAPIRQRWNEITAKDGDGKTKSADLLEEAQDTLNEAYRISNRRLSAVRQEDEAKSQRAVEAARETGAADALEDAGVYRTDVGTAPAGAGPMTYAEAAGAFNRGEINDEQFMEIRNKR